jgi:misacylated tRNA(Ala) deacylase
VNYLQDSVTETKQLYLDDSYQKEFDAKILEVIEIVDDATLAYVVLNQTLFYPRGGGQPSDVGVFKYSNAIDNCAYNVIEVIKREGRILHKVELSNLIPLKAGQIIHGIIDWDRRYMLMRMHTASHLIDAVLYRDGKIMVTGNQLDVDKSRIDFNMPEFSMEKVQEYIHEANNIIKKNL